MGLPALLAAAAPYAMKALPIAASLLGGIGGGSKARVRRVPVTQTTTQGSPEFQKNLRQFNLELPKAYRRFQDIYQPYTGQLVAPMSADELTGTGLIRGLATGGQPLIAGSQGYLGNVLGGSLTDPERISGIASPLVKRTLERALPAQGNIFSRLGGFSSSDFKNRMSDITSDVMARIMPTLYGQGLSATTSAVSQTPSIYGLGYQPGQSLLGIGALQRGIAQRGLASEYDRYLGNLNLQTQPIKLFSDLLRQPVGSQTTKKDSVYGEAPKSTGMLGGALKGLELGSKLADKLKLL